MKEVEILDYLY